MVWLNATFGLGPYPVAPPNAPPTGSSRSCTTAPFLDTHTVASPYTRTSHCAVAAPMPVVASNRL